MVQGREEEEKTIASVESDSPVWSAALKRSEVRRMLEKTCIPAAEIARRIGIQRQTLDYQLKGDKFISQELLKKIQKAVDDIQKETGITQTAPKAGAKGRNSLQNHIEYAEESLYPILKKFQFINGEPDMTKQNIDGFAFYPASGKKDFFAVINYGDSMKAKDGPSIGDRYIVFIDLTQKIVNGDLVLVHLKPNRDLIRQIIFLPDGKIDLKSLNEKDPDVILDREEIEAMGRVCGYHPPITHL